MTKHVTVQLEFPRGRRLFALAVARCCTPIMRACMWAITASARYMAKGTRPRRRGHGA